MQLALQITTGPHTGRKVLLRSGQVARIGRTEWADFSFPRDGELADVHFAVQCSLQGARVRQLAPDRPLLVNAQPITELELKPGDTIQAGKSSFVVAFDGQSAAAPSPATVAAATAAPAVPKAAAAVTATVGAASEPEPTASEIAQHLELSEDAAAIAATVKTGPELVAALAARGQFAKAVRVQGHLLPKRLAVWWGICCVDESCGALPTAEAAARDAAYRWVEQPGEGRGRTAEAAAAKTKYDGPGSWLAMASFWSGGSVAPPEMAAVPPDDKLTGQAVTSSLMIAAVFGDPSQAKQRYQAFLAKAPQVASGAIPLPESN
jgi:hypothetical protein